MKRGVFVVLFVFVFSISFCLATEVKIINDSLVDTNYTTGSIISGFLNFSLKNVPANAIITSNFGGNISLKDFMAANEQPLSCAVYGCSDVYNTSSSGATSKSFSYPSQDIFGFKLDSGKNVQIERIGFNLSSDFPSSNEVPLDLNLFEKTSWKFEDASGQFDRFPEARSYGCYDFNAPKAGDSEIGSVRYCEKIDDLPSSKVYMLGANISGTGPRKVIMSLRSENDASGEECNFEANKTNSCVINLTESLPEANYYICITAEDKPNKYIMSRENAGVNCGFFDSTDQLGSSDFPIFVKLPMYASSSTFNLGAISSDDFKKFVFYANQYLTETYSNDCSSGCVFPVKIVGAKQNLQVSSIDVGYRTNEAGLTSTNKVYSLSSTPFLVSFENSSVDLSKLGFELNSSGTKNLIISVDGTKILEKTISVLVAPTIKSLQPMNPPAGVPTTFTLNVSSAANITGYEWNFGDGSSSVKTSTNSVSHTYTNKTIYNLQVSVTDSSGVTAKKNFTVVSGNPSDIINLTITAKNIKLDNLVTSLNSYPTWQSDYIKSILNLDTYKSELKRLDDKRKTLVTDTELVGLALELYNLTIPQGIFVVSETPVPFLVNPSDVDPTPLKKLSGGIGGDDISGYKPGIAQWERENIVGVTLIKRFEVLGDDGQSRFLMNLYSVNIESKSSDESYFIINKNIGTLKADGTVELKDSDSFSYLSIPAETKKIFNFVYSAGEDLKFYVSPIFSKLPYENAPIGACNFNLVCEAKLGENYNNCRSDCKPVGKTIYWIILVIIFGLALYTVLQEWYKRNYEKVLFEDRAHLFNLVNYIDNMASRGVVEGEIRRKLAEQEWTSEKINYAFKKSKGQRVGMYELIPVEKILSKLRQNESKKQVRANPSVMPQTPRMIMPQNTNLNKAKNPNSNIKRW